MPADDDLQTWRAVVERLCRGPAPRGETFDLCRGIVAQAPHRSEAESAVRTLLEGAMTDCLTAIADAQDTMRALRALDRGEVSPRDLIPV
ncbi:MAG: hypothetical protein AB1625_00295 [Acidobacteriota bacterium]